MSEATTPIVGQITLRQHEQGDPRFFKLLEEAWALHQSKGSDYASFADNDFLANLREVEEIEIDAFTGVLVRLSDKWSRIKSLYKKMKQGKGTAVKDESIIDTFRDIAAYSYLAIILLQERASRPASSRFQQVNGALYFGDDGMLYRRLSADAYQKIGKMAANWTEPVRQTEDHTPVGSTDSPTTV